MNIDTVTRKTITRKIKGDIITKATIKENNVAMIMKTTIKQQKILRIVFIMFILLLLQQYTLLLHK